MHYAPRTPEFDRCAHRWPGSAITSSSRRQPTQRASGSSCPQRPAEADAQETPQQRLPRLQHRDFEHWVSCALACGRKLAEHELIACPVALVDGGAGAQHGDRAVPAARRFAMSLSHAPRRLSPDAIRNPVPVHAFAMREPVSFTTCEPALIAVTASTLRTIHLPPRNWIVSSLNWHYVPALNWPVICARLATAKANDDATSR